MLYLFPDIYWVLLIVAAVTRIIAGRIIAYKINQLKINSKNITLVKMISSPYYNLFYRHSDMAYLTLIICFFLIFFIRDHFIVPVNYYSLRAWVTLKFVAFTLLFVEMAIALYSVIACAYLINKSREIK